MTEAEQKIQVGGKGEIIKTQRHILTNGIMAGVVWFLDILYMCL